MSREDDARRFQRIGTVLVALGAVLVVVGIVGLAAGWGESTSTGVEAASPGTTTTVPGETVEAFLAAFGAALRDGNTTYLLDRLHPAVIQRYGTEVCRARVVALRDPTAQWSLVQVQGTGDYAWTTDGQTTTVPNTATVVANRVSNGASSQQTIHLTKVDGRYRWYTDCTP